MAEQELYQPLKRKRITTDILSTGSINVTRTNDREDKVKKLEELVDRVKRESTILKTDLEAKEISYKLDLELKGKEINKLLDTNRHLEEQVVLQSRRYDEAKKTLAKFKEKHIEEMKDVTNALGKEQDKIAQLERTVKEQALALQTAQAEFAATKNELASNLQLLEKSNQELNRSLEEKSKKVIETLQHDQKLLEEIRILKKKLHDRDDIYSCSNDNNNNDSANNKNDTNVSKIMQDYYHVSARLMNLEDEKRKLEKDLGYYKRINQNIELLREEKQSLAERVKDVDAIRERNYALETENLKLKAEHDAWACYLSNSQQYNAQTPESIIYQLTRELEEAKYYKLAGEQYKEELKEQLNVVQSLEQHVDELNRKMTEYQQRQVKEDAAKSLWKQNEDTLKMHIQILQSQLKMYDDATLMESNQDNNQQQSSETDQLDNSHHNTESVNSFDDIKSKRIEELEALVKQLETKLSEQTQQMTLQIVNTPTNQINTNTAAAASGPSEALSSSARITQILTQLQKKEEAHIEQLKEKQLNEAMLEKKYNAALKQLESLRKTVETRKQLDSNFTIPSHREQTQEEENEDNAQQQLEHQQHLRTLDDIEIDPNTQQMKTVKILQSIESPVYKLTAYRQETVDRLRQEIKDLLKQLFDNQHSTTHPETVTVPQSTITNLQKDIEHLQEELDKREKRIKRVQKAWQGRLKDVNEMVCKFLGYDIQFVGNNYDLFRLIPVSPCLENANQLQFIIKRLPLYPGYSFQEEREQQQQQTKYIEATVVDEKYRYVFRIVGTEKEKWLALNMRDSFIRYIMEERNIPAFLSNVTLDLVTEAQCSASYEAQAMDSEQTSQEQYPYGDQVEGDTEMDQQQQDDVAGEPFQPIESGHEGQPLSSDQQQELDHIQHQLVQQFSQPYPFQQQTSNHPAVFATIGESRLVQKMADNVQEEEEEEEDPEYDENDEYDRVEEDAYDENEYLNQETAFMDDVDQEVQYDEGEDDDEMYDSYEEGDEDHNSEVQSRFQGGHSHDEPVLIDDSSDDDEEEQQQLEPSQQESIDQVENEKVNELEDEGSDISHDYEEHGDRDENEEQVSETEFGEITEESYRQLDEPAVVRDSSDEMDEGQGGDNEDRDDTEERIEKASISDRDLATDEEEEDAEEEEAEEGLEEQTEADEGLEEQTEDVDEDVEERAKEVQESVEEQTEHVEEQQNTQKVDGNEESRNLDRIADLVTNALASLHEQQQTAAQENEDIDAVMVDSNDIPYDSTSPVLVERDVFINTTTTIETVTKTTNPQQAHQQDTTDTSSTLEQDDQVDASSVKLDSNVHSPVIVINEEADTEAMIEEQNHDHAE